MITAEQHVRYMEDFKETLCAMQKANEAMHKISMIDKSYDPIYRSMLKTTKAWAKIEHERALVYRGEE